MSPTFESAPQYGGCTYSASYGGWSACSSGSQSRSVTCLRSDGAAVPTSYCGFSGSPSSQTQSCATYAWSRSEEHTSELQSLMRISYAVFCLKKKKIRNKVVSYNRCHTLYNTYIRNNIIQSHSIYKSLHETHKIHK